MSNRTDDYDDDYDGDDDDDDVLCIQTCQVCCLVTTYLILTLKSL